MAKKKKKQEEKRKSLSTAAARAEKIAARNTTVSTKSVASNSPFKKASQQTATPKSSKKQTTKTKKTNGQSTTSGTARNRSNVESRIASISKHETANRNVAAKAYAKENGSAASRIADAHKTLKDNKGMFDAAGTRGKQMYRQKKTEIYNKAKNHASDKDARDMIKNGGFSKKEQKELNAIRLNGYDTSATLDLDKSSIKKEAEKATAKKHTAFTNDKHSSDEYRSRIAKKQAKKDTDTTRALRAFNTKDTEAFASGKTLEASSKNVEALAKKAQENPTNENVLAFQQAYEQYNADRADYLAKDEARENAYNAYRHTVRYGKGNIDLTDLPKNVRNGRTTSYATGASELGTALFGSGNAFLHYDEDTKEYVLVPNYVKNNGKWDKVNEKEAWAYYKQNNKYLGKFKSEEEANAYIEELRNSQGQMLDDEYARQSEEYNDLKNAKTEAKNAWKDASRNYELLQKSGATESELKKAKKAKDDARKAYEEADEAKSEYKDTHADVDGNLFRAAASTIAQGWKTADAGVDASLAMFANRFDKDNDNFFTRRAEATNRVLEAQRRNSRAVTGTAKWQKTAQEYATEAVAAVPDLIIAVMTGPEGAVTKLGARAAGVSKAVAPYLTEAGEIASSKALTRAAFEGMGSMDKAEVLLRTMAKSSKEMLTNPNFSTSFMRMAGASYDAAIEDGATEKQAFSQGILNGVLGSMLEVGEVGGEGIFGGIQKAGLYKKYLAKGDMKAANKFLRDSVIGEGLEEVGQGIVERLLQTVTYGADNPVFSTSDPNAIINPLTAGQEFAGGAIVGGVLGGATTAVGAVTQPGRDVRAGMQSRDIGMMRIQQALQYDENSKTYKLAKELDERLKNQRQKIEDAGQGAQETVFNPSTKMEAAAAVFTQENTVNKTKAPTEVTDKELGKLIRLMYTENEQYGPKNMKSAPGENELDENIQRFLRTASTRKGSDGSPVRISALDALRLDVALETLVETNGETEGEDAIPDADLKKALENSVDINSHGFKVAVNQLYGAEVLSDEEMTMDEVISALRTGAKEANERRTRSAEALADQAMMEAAEEDDAEEALAEEINRVQGETASEAESSELAEEDETAPADIAQLAEETAQQKKEREEEKARQLKDADILEAAAKQMRTEGRTEDADLYEAEADEIRQRAELEDDGQERVYIGGTLYTRDSLHEYYENKMGGEVPREMSDKAFDKAKAATTTQSLAVRHSLMNDGEYGPEPASPNVQFDGVALNETQIIMGDYASYALRKDGITRVIYQNNEAMGGSKAFYTKDTVFLNADILTTQDLLSSVIGHEFTHTKSTRIAESYGQELDSKEGDQLTNTIIGSIQDVVQKMYDADSNNTTNKQLKAKYIDGYEDLLERTTERYINHEIYLYGLDHDLLYHEVADKDGNIMTVRRSIAEIRAEMPATEVDEIETRIKDRDSAYIRQEIAADWIGEMAGQQDLLGRLADDHPTMVVRLAKTVQRMRRQSVGMVLPSANGGVINVASREFTNTIEGIFDTLTSSIEEARARTEEYVKENGGKSTPTDSTINDIRFGLLSDFYGFDESVENRLSQKQRAALKKQRLEGLSPEQREAYREAVERDDEAKRYWKETGEIPDFLRTTDEKEMNDFFAKHIRSVLYGDLGLEKYGSYNYVLRRLTPRFVQQFGVDANAPMGISVLTTANAGGDLESAVGRHTEAHRVPVAALTRMPEWIANSCFVSNSFNNPTRKFELTNQDQPQIVFVSSEIDDRGGVIMYVMVPNVKGVATVSGVDNIACNAVISCFGKLNMFGEVTQYDAQVDAEIAKVKKDPGMSEEAKAKAIHELEQYKSDILYADVLNLKGKGKDSNYIKPQKTTQVGKRIINNDAWQETGFMAECIRRHESLYTDRDKIDEVVQKLNHWRQNDWYKQQIRLADKNHTYPPPRPNDIRLPTTLLDKRGQPRTGKHRHTNLPKNITRNFGDTDKANTKYGGFTYFKNQRMPGSRLNAVAERMRRTNRYALPEEGEIPADRRFVGTHRLTQDRLYDAIASGEGLFAPSVSVTNPERAIARSKHDTFGNTAVVFNRTGVGYIDPAEDERNVLDGVDTWTPTKSNMPPKQYLFTQDDIDDYNFDMIDLANSYYGTADEPVYDEDVEWATQNQYHLPYTSSDRMRFYDAMGDMPQSMTSFVGERSYQDRLFTPPDDYVENALRRNIDRNGKLFFHIAYLADNGYRATGDEQDIANQLQELEKRSETEADVPTIEEWLYEKYVSHASAVGRPSMWVADFFADDMYPNDPVRSFWNDSYAPDEEGETEALFAEGDKWVGLTPSGIYGDARKLAAMLKPRYGSIEEAREDYEKLGPNEQIWSNPRSPDNPLTAKLYELTDAINGDLIQADLNAKRQEPTLDRPTDFEEEEDSAFDFSAFEEDNYQTDFVDDAQEISEEEWQHLLRSEELTAENVIFDTLMLAEHTREGVERFANEVGYPLSRVSLDMFEELFQEGDRTIVPYFEAKRKGYVPVEAIGGVVLPVDAEPKLINLLKSKGIPYVIAKANGEEAMAEAVRSFEDLRFSLPEETGNEELDNRLTELTNEENQLTAQLEMGLSPRAREATERELAEKRNTISALTYSNQATRFDLAEQDGQLVDIPNPRIATPEDIFNAVWNTETDSGTIADVVAKFYRSAGRKGTAPRTTTVRQSSFNENTMRVNRYQKKIVKDMQDDNERRRMLSTLSKVKDEGYYDVISEEQSMTEALRRLEADFDGERAKLENSNEEMGSADLDVAMGILMTDLATKDPEKFMKTARIIQEKATTAGQFIQAFAKYSRSPEGLLVDALNDLERANLNDKKKAELTRSLTDLASMLSSIQEGDMEGIIDLIVKQAKIRKTPISNFTINSLRQSNFQTNLDRAMAQFRMIPRDYIKASVGEKASTYQVLAQLLNVRTAGRNFLGNVSFGEIDALLGNNTAALIDSFISIFNGGKRSVGFQGGFFTGRGVQKGAWQGMRQEAANVSLDIDPYGTATKYGNSKRTWHKVNGPVGSAMSTLEKVLGYELNVSDEWSKGGIHTQVMNSFKPLIERGIITQEEAEMATQSEMLYRTFQDDTKFGKLLGLIHDAGNMLVGVGDSGKRIAGFTVHSFGLGDFVQKYTTVPGALLTRAIEYSPAGYMKLISNAIAMHKANEAYRLESSKEHANTAKLAEAHAAMFMARRGILMTLGRATSGTGLILAFAMLSGMGLINDEDDGDSTAEKNYETLRGLQGVSGTQLNWTAFQRWITGGFKDEDTEWRQGDALMDISFLEPLNAAMSMGALVTKGDDWTGIRDFFKNTSAKEVGGSSLISLWNAAADLPTMQTIGSLQTALQYYDPDDVNMTFTDNADLKKGIYVGLEIAKGSATGFIPAFARQAAQNQDDYYRDTYSQQDEVGQIKDAIRNVLPNVTDELDWDRQTLPTKLTPFGEDKKAEEGTRRMLNAFFMPGQIRTYQTDEVYEALNDAYATSGDDTIFPKRNAPKSLDFGDEREMTYDERRKYQTTYGQTIAQSISDLAQSDKYKQASAEKKATLVAEAKKIAEMDAKSKIAAAFGTSYGNDTLLNKYKSAKAVGLDLDIYNEFHTAANGDKGQASKGRAEAWLNSTGKSLTPEQKRVLWQSCNTGWKNCPY